MKKIIIEGVTKNGSKFRPSDWAERMCGALSTFGRDQRIRYSPLLHPLTNKGVKCISVDPELQQSHPELFAYIMQWVESNRLNVFEIDDTESIAANG